MNHIFFTHSSTDGHLGCIHVLATADNAAVDMGLRHKWVTSVSLHTGHTMLFDYHSSLLMSEQGFSTLAASRSQENFVQAQTACLQTKLEKELNSAEHGTEYPFFLLIRELSAQRRADLVEMSRLSSNLNL